MKKPIPGSTTLQRARARSATLRRLLSASLASLMVMGCSASSMKSADAAPSPMMAGPPMAMAAPPSPSPEASPAPPPPGAYAPPASPADATLAAGLQQPVPPSSPQPAPAGRQAAASKSAPPPKQPTPAKSAEPPAKTAASATSKVDPTTPAAPLLIYTGELTMLVDEGAIASTIDATIDVAEGLGGYLAGRKDANVVVRVPSSRFREALTKLEKIGEVTHRSVTADDVSEQYSDLEVRLQNLRATQKRLQEFLAKSGTMQDMLSVEHELERVAAEINAIEGKMRFLRSRAAFSTITVNLAPKPKTVAVVAAVKQEVPPREVDLPISWLDRLGLETLLNLR